MSSLLIPELAHDGSQITVLDPDAERLGRLPEEPYLEAILTSEPEMQDYLQQGGISNAEALLALSEDDHKNALIAQIALHIFNVPTVICRLDSPQLQRFYSGLGLNVVSSTSFLLRDIHEAIEGRTERL